MHYCHCEGYLCVMFPFCKFSRADSATLGSSWILPTTPTVHFTSVNQLQLGYKDIIPIFGTHCISAVNYTTKLGGNTLAHLRLKCFLYE